MFIQPLLRPNLFIVRGTLASFNADSTGFLPVAGLKECWNEINNIDVKCNKAGEAKFDHHLEQILNNYNLYEQNLKSF